MLIAGVRLNSVVKDVVILGLVMEVFVGVVVVLMGVEVVMVIMDLILCEHLIIGRIPRNRLQGHRRGHVPSLAFGEVTGHSDLRGASGGGILWLLEGRKHGLLELISEGLLLRSSGSGLVWQRLGWGHASHQGLLNELLIPSGEGLRLLLLTEGADLSGHEGG